MGSSPRVRSGPRQGMHSVPQGGIISACAERTPAVPRPTSTCWDHLRVCGADSLIDAGEDAAAGSSPRVRSGLHAKVISLSKPGIISACAERTISSSFASPMNRDHLRVCGADSCILLWFGLVGCRGIFDSCTALGRKTTWMPIFGIDALGSRMFLCEISEPSPCAEFWLRLHCVHVR